MANRTEPLSLDEAKDRGIVCSQADAGEYLKTLRYVKTHDVMKYGENKDYLDEGRRDKKGDLSWNAKEIEEIGGSFIGPYALGGMAAVHLFAQKPVNYVLSEIPGISEHNLRKEFIEEGYEKFAEKYNASLKNRIRVVKKLLEKKREEGLPAKRFIREIKISQSYDHPSFPRAIYADPEDYTMVCRKFDATQFSHLGNTRNSREKFHLGIHMWRNFTDFYAAGILHRDITPNNVLADNNSLETRIIDFGLSSVKTVEELSWEHMKEQQAITQHEFVEATPSCASPEVVEHTLKVHTVQSDIFSAAATFYALLTGREYMQMSQEELAASSNPTFEFVCKILNWAHGKSGYKIPPIHEVNPTIPDFGLNELLVDRCMAVNPRDRPSSFSEVYRDLVNLEKKLSSDAMTRDLVYFQLPTATQRTAMISEAEILEEQKRQEETHLAQLNKRRATSIVKRFEKTPDTVIISDNSPAKNYGLDKQSPEYVIQEDSSDLQEAIDSVEVSDNFFEGFEDLIRGNPSDTQALSEAIKKQDATEIIPHDRDATVIIPGNQDVTITMGPEERESFNKTEQINPFVNEKTIILDPERQRKFFEETGQIDTIKETSVNGRLPRRDYENKLPIYTPRRLGPKRFPHNKFCKK